MRRIPQTCSAGLPFPASLTRRASSSCRLNPLAIVGAFNGILTLFKGALIYDYALLNESSNIIAIIWVWGVRLVFALIGLRMLNQAFPQIGNVLARLR